MPAIASLRPEQLNTCCDLEVLDFETTDGLADEVDLVGQPRVLAAMRVGIEVGDRHYNVFAVGPTGTGKRHFVQRYLSERAVERPAPSDLCYVNNFAEPNKPIALLLPAGRGAEFRRRMGELVDEVTTVLPAAFESEEYQARVQAITDELKKRSTQRIEQLQERARGRGIAMVQTPMGMAFTPLRDGEPLDQEAMAQLDAAEQERVRADIEELQSELQRAKADVPRWERERRERVRELERDVSERAIGHLIEELKEAFADHRDVFEHLDAVRRDLVENARYLLKAQEQQMEDPLKAAALQAQSGQESPFWRRYRVNLLIDRSETSGAPVVYEDNPTYQNLLGRIEHVTQFGALSTDFTLIRPGALHRANGGYLVLEALELMRQPFAWDGLKRALKSARLKTESPGQAYALISTLSLEPEPVPLDVKVVLIGDPVLYHLLSRLDPEFFELFKVTADFDERIDRSVEHQRQFARLVATIVRRHGLRPFDRSAVGRVIEDRARSAGDAERLSSHTASLADLLQEADYWAGAAGHEPVGARDVQRAIDERIYRADRLRARLLEEMLRNTIYIDTTGSRVGQVNGLSVVALSSSGARFTRRACSSWRASWARATRWTIPSRCRPVWSSSSRTAASRATAPRRPSSTRCSPRSPRYPCHKPWPRRGRSTSTARSSRSGVSTRRSRVSSISAAGGG